MAGANCFVTCVMLRTMTYVIMSVWNASQCFDEVCECYVISELFYLRIKPCFVFERNLASGQQLFTSMRGHNHTESLERHAHFYQCAPLLSLLLPLFLLLVCILQ